jgi:hypothetical protein
VSRYQLDAANPMNAPEAWWMVKDVCERRLVIEGRVRFGYNDKNRALLPIDHRKWMGEI